MKVVCPWTQIHPETRAFLDNCGHNVTYEYVGESPLAYGQLVHKLWSKGITFTVVEHDILPHPQAFHEMLECEHPYCSLVYPWTTNIGAALGCTTFAGTLIRQYPTAADQARETAWNQMDYMLMRVSLFRAHGLAPHLHLPPAQHLNPSQALVPPWDTWTVEEHLNSLGWKIAPDGRTADFVGGGGYS